MVITRKIQVGISSNFLHSISTSICIRKYNKKFLWFLSHFLEKTMGYSPCFFPKIGQLFKIVITQKIQVGISSNFLHSIRTSMCIRKCNKKFLWFLSHFLEKTMGYSPCFFPKIGQLFKIFITQKIQVGISSNFLHSIRTSMCIRKCNKIFLWFLSHFLEKTMGYAFFRKLAHFKKWS